MKKIALMMVMAASCNMYGMDQRPIIELPKYQGPTIFRPLETEKDLVERHASLLQKRVVFGANPGELKKLLWDAGAYATTVVSVIRKNSGYGSGTILDATFVENKPAARKILEPYMNKQMLQHAFVHNKNQFNLMRSTESYQKGLMTNWPVVLLVQYLYEKDSNEYTLDADELEALNLEIKKLEESNVRMEKLRQKESQ